MTKTTTMVEEVKAAIKSGIRTYSVKSETTGKDIIGSITTIAVTKNGMVMNIMDNKLFIPSYISYDEKENVIRVIKTNFPYITMNTKHHALDDAVKIYNDTMTMLMSNCELTIVEYYNVDDIMTEDINQVDKLIAKCNTDSTRKSVGEILQLPEKDIILIINEYDIKPDSRFGYKLLYACIIVKRLREDWNYSTMFQD
jgi:mRNA-degrading endonuclease HigB of HigAB toxin-antitoxin module